MSTTSPTDNVGTGGITAARIASLVEENVAKLASTLRGDYLAALEASVSTETSERGREVLSQLIANAGIAAAEGFPLCQDTGYVWVCLEVLDPAVLVPADIFCEVDAAVTRATEAAGMRESLVRDALFDRSNTGTNTPVFCEVVFSACDTVDRGTVPDKRGRFLFVWENQTNRNRPLLSGTVPLDSPAILHIMLKGGGSDNASALTMLPPGAGREGVVDFVVERVAAKGANACPPLVVGVGVGGTFDKVAGLAKHALLRKVGDIHPHPEAAALEAELLARINALGIGPGGLGGSTTALAVHLETAPCHIAALPVAVNIGCTALRSVSIPLKV